MSSRSNIEKLSRFGGSQCGCTATSGRTGADGRLAASVLGCGVVDDGVVVDGVGAVVDVVGVVVNSVGGVVDDVGVIVVVGVGDSVVAVGVGVVVDGAVDCDCVVVVARAVVASLKIT